MKQVSKEDLAQVHGGSEPAPACTGVVAPYPESNGTIGAPTPAGSPLPPTLPEKHVET